MAPTRLGQHQHGGRVRAQQDLLQRAVLEIGAEQGIQRQHRGKQRRDPDNAGGDGLKDPRLGGDAHGKQRHHDDEEQQRVGHLGAVPEGQRHVPPEQRQEGGAQRVLSYCFR